MRAKLAFMVLGFGMGLTSAVVAVLLLLSMGAVSHVGPASAAAAQLAPHCPRALNISADAGCPFLQAVRQQRLSEGRCPVTGAVGHGLRAQDRAPLPQAPEVPAGRAPLEL